METNTKFEIIFYKTSSGKEPFSEWLQKLDRSTRTTIKRRLDRIMSQGNLGDSKSIGSGVWEFRIHDGPGYRVYFGKRGTRIVVLLLGGDKGSQSRDIAQAQKYWLEYTERKI
jgi:putative addiction module killer protein